MVSMSCLAASLTTPWSPRVNLDLELALHVTSPSSPRKALAMALISTKSPCGNFLVTVSPGPPIKNACEYINSGTNRKGIEADSAFIKNGSTLWVSGRGPYNVSCTGLKHTSSANVGILLSVESREVFLVSLTQLAARLVPPIGRDTVLRSNARVESKHTMEIACAGTYY